MIWVIRELVKSRLTKGLVEKVFRVIREVGIWVIRGPVKKVIFRLN